MSIHFSLLSTVCFKPLTDRETRDSSIGTLTRLRSVRPNIRGTRFSFT